MSDTDALDLERIRLEADRAVRAIPPLWPLASSVAVNPFIGQADEGLAQAAARLARVAGATLTPPRASLREKIAGGEITDDDLRAALSDAPVALRPPDLGALKAATQRDASLPARLPTVADLAAEVSGTAWPDLLADRIGAWAAAHFDQGQALWAAPQGPGAFTAWRVFAVHDLTPEILGLSGFARHVADAPERALPAIARAARTLGLHGACLPTYFHQLLMTLGGWSQLARYKLWQAELAGEDDQTAVDLLAIRLLWEEALFLRHGEAIARTWSDVRERHAAPVEATPELVVDAILQDAAERASQRELAACLARPPRSAVESRPALQAAFCIDVRSEVFRRALEAQHPEIRTLGFAGFFGMATAHRRFASDVEERRLPVLLNPSLKSEAASGERSGREARVRIEARAVRAWGRFKLAAVSSFAFVEGAGPIYVGKLLADGLGLAHGKAPPDPPPRFTSALDLDERPRSPRRCCAPCRSPRVSPASFS